MTAEITLSRPCVCLVRSPVGVEVCKKPMDLIVSESEECGHGVMGRVCVCMLLYYSQICNLSYLTGLLRTCPQITT